MAHELLRYSNLVFNTPQFVTEPLLRLVATYLRDRNTVGLSDPIYQGGPGEGLETEELDIFNGVGVIQLSGLMTYKPMEMECAPEHTSYTELVEEVQEMCDAGVKAIVFECDSGGGEASHMMQCADKLREILDASGVASVAT